MSGEIGAAGEIVSGALLARAVEPDTGGTHADAHGHCLNCQTELIGSYCYHCGQSAHIHRTLVSFWHDISHALLHFDGKIWRTLPLLAFRPGQLTRRYVHGERARFVSPLALFLFSIFLLFSAFRIDSFAPADSSVNRDGKTLNVQQVQQQVAADEVKLSKLKAQRAAHSGEADERLDKQIEDTQDEVDILKYGLTVKQGFSSDVVKKSDIHFHTGSSAWDNQLEEKAKRAKDNPELLFFKMEEGAHKYSWIIIPLSVPFLWLTLFWRRDLKLLDHVVFVTYSACFMLSLIVIISLLAGVPQPHGFRPSLFVFAVPTHLFFQLKGAYQLKTMSALWRTFVMLFAMIIVLSIYAAAIVVLSL